MQEDIYRPHPKIVAVLGATATGKTDLATQLALRFDGEVVSIDSRYLYRGLDIGTAKPSMTERRGVRHHLIDVLDPTEDYSLALYQRDAYAAVDEILARARVPVLAGGSPLYARAVLEGWQIPQVPPDPEFRARMNEFTELHGNEQLYRKLQHIDPIAAKRIDPANLRRVIRALEVHHHTGVPMSELEGKDPPKWEALLIGLFLDREELYRRIDARVQGMIEQGLIDEVRRLVEAEVSEDKPAMRSIGYQETIPWLRGEYHFDELVKRIQANTHRYVRHQLTWLRKTPGIEWFDMSDAATPHLIEQRVEEFLAK